MYIRLPAVRRAAADDLYLFRRQAGAVPDCVGGVGWLADERNAAVARDATLTGNVHNAKDCEELLMPHFRLRFPNLRYKALFIATGRSILYLIMPLPLYVVQT